jgi:hypothetical protein
MELQSIIEFREQRLTKQDLNNLRPVVMLSLSGFLPLGPLAIHFKFFPLLLLLASTHCLKLCGLLNRGNLEASDAPPSLIITGLSLYSDVTAVTFKFSSNHLDDNVYAFTPCKTGRFLSKGRRVI